MFLHDNNIVHCDVKPENCLIDHTGYLKLADMGLAKKIKVELVIWVTNIATTPHKFANTTRCDISTFTDQIIIQQMTGQSQCSTTKEKL